MFYGFYYPSGYYKLTKEPMVENKNMNKHVNKEAVKDGVKRGKRSPLKRVWFAWIRK